MRKRFLLAALLVLVAGLGSRAAQQANAAGSSIGHAGRSAGVLNREAQAGSRTCWTYFEVTVNQGTDAGTILVGTLTLNIDASGAVMGSLDNGPMPVVAQGYLALASNTVPVTGQATGHAVNLIFEVGKNQYLFGTGASQADLNTCNGAMLGFTGGPATGPAVDDLGSWDGATLRDYAVCYFALPYCVYLYLHG